MENRFIRQTLIRPLTEKIYFIICPLNGSNDRLTLEMCYGRQGRDLCKGGKNRAVKGCQYRREV